MSVTARAYFYRQMATLLDAGIPIRSTLSTLAEQTSGPLRRAALHLGQSVDEGHNLAEGLADNRHFSLIEREMLSAGEQSGRLEANARLLAELFEYRKKMIGQLISGLAYPVILIHMAILISSVPKIFSHSLHAFGMQLAVAFGALYGVALGVYLAYRLTRAWSPLGIFCESLLLTTPVLGGIYRKTVSSRFARSLAGLYEAGIPLSHALEVSTRAAASPTLNRRLLPGVSRLAAGETLLTVLTESRFFSKVLLSMVSTGETSGKLGQTLVKSADYAEDEARNGLKILMVLLPMVVFLMIAAAIAYHIIQSYRGILSKMGI